ncbi:nitrate- and nitrite sensing domain-containing protein [Kiloniella sp. b19]|uniref:nitrate- and nitrite sensing domain-containing protein n=1 Tax=Kiloniella sp. GXU_MW_B19 TaxID=3141326 RepID=UPI0031D3C698
MPLESKIRSVLLLASGLPIFLALCFASYLVYENVQAIRTVNSLSKLAHLSLHLNALVHEQQIERGLSTGFLSNEGQLFEEEMEEQRALTDREVRILRFVLKNTPFQAMPQRLQDQQDMLLQSLSLTPTLRTRIDERTTGSNEVINFFTGLNTQSININAGMALLSHDAEIANMIHSYVLFTKLKEYSSIERAVGTAGFSAGHFSFQNLNRFKELVTIQNTLADTFRSFASEGQRAFYFKARQDPAFGEIDTIRQSLIKNTFIARNTEVDPRIWFSTMTQKIDMLQDVEDRLASDILIKIEELHNQALFFTIAISSAIGATILLITAVLHSLFKKTAKALQEEREREREKEHEPRTATNHRQAPPIRPAHWNKPAFPSDPSPVAKPARQKLPQRSD